MSAAGDTPAAPDHAMLAAHSPNSTTLIMQVPAVRETSAFIQATWRPLGGFICMCAVAQAVLRNPTVENMWVAAACAGVGVLAGTVQKVTELTKKG